jgi:hypothetical protein
MTFCSAYPLMRATTALLITMSFTTLPRAGAGGEETLS